MSSCEGEYLTEQAGRRNRCLFFYRSSNEKNTFYTSSSRFYGSFETEKRLKKIGNIASDLSGISLMSLSIILIKIEPSIHKISNSKRYIKVFSLEFEWRFSDVRVLRLCCFAPKFKLWRLGLRPTIIENINEGSELWFLHNSCALWLIINLLEESPECG